MTDYTTSEQKKTTRLNDNSKTSISLSRRITRRTTHTPPERTKSAAGISTAKGAPVSTSFSRPSSLVTQSSHPQSSSSAVEWGPAITASAVPHSKMSGSHSPASQPSPSLSGGSKKTLIVVTTIGGTLILALLIYALWRRRKGATYSEIVRFRPHSGTIILSSSSRNERLTALPIFREERYSVRSSKIGSTLSLGKAMKRPSGLPPNIVKNFHQQQPWIQDTWKTTNPPTPRTSRHPLAQMTASSPHGVDLPETTAADTGPEDIGRRAQKPSGDTTKPSLNISIKETPPAEDEIEVPSDRIQSPKDPEARWSRTNSQAPLTPRAYASSYRSSLSSLPKYKTVKAWVRAQAERQSHRIVEERPPTSRSAAVPILQNKASKPNLAPKPARKLSKKKRSESKFSLVIQSNTDTAGPAPPAPATLPLQRP